jgi:hypothetical protein
MSKQQTLEEAAEKYADFSNDYVPMSFGGKFNGTTKNDFIAGAKWQEERMFQLHDEWITYVVEHFLPEFSSISFRDYVKQVNNK